jgi:hypothetical protein
MSVESLLASLDHPHKPAIDRLRQILLDADPRIGEGVKWNAPSFHTSEYFATVHLRAKAGVQLILHAGAKKREHAVSAAAITDPESLLVWLAEDRASVTFRDLADVEAKRSAFTDVIRQWIELL